jgi:hypothetical protein
MISVQPPDNIEGVNNDVVCVIDISCSMEEEAEVKNKEGVKEGQGLSKIDVLKHAIKTTIMSLGENDRFGLVSFCEYSKVEYQLKEMTPQE